MRSSWPALGAALHMSLLGLIRHTGRRGAQTGSGGDGCRRGARAGTWSTTSRTPDWAGAVADPAVVPTLRAGTRSRLRRAVGRRLADLAVRSPMQDARPSRCGEVILHIVEEYGPPPGHAGSAPAEADRRPRRPVTPNEPGVCPGSNESAQSACHKVQTWVGERDLADLLFCVVPVSPGSLNDENASAGVIMTAKVSAGDRLPDRNPSRGSGWPAWLRIRATAGWL